LYVRLFFFFFFVEIAPEQSAADVIQAGCETLCSQIRDFINSVWNKEELL
jgi:hypothetical protein